MPTNTPKPEDTYSEKETVARREAALRNLLTTPHKLQRDSKKSGKKSQVK